jgi:hypothetical protein
MDSTTVNSDARHSATSVIANRIPGNSHQPIHDPHDDAVEPARCAGNEADEHTEQQTQQSNSCADNERHASAIQNAAVDIAAKAVGSHPERVLKADAIRQDDGA